MLKVYVTDCKFLKDSEEWNRQLKRVSLKRAEQICSFHSPDDRRRSLAVSLLLRLALSQEGVSLENVCMGKGAQGKPFLEESKVCFNLSHSGEWAVCAVSDQEVGVDVESLCRFEQHGNRMQGIVRRCLNEKERMHWENSKNQGEELVRIWTRKESFVKMTGEGLSRNFTTVDTLTEGFFQQRNLPGGYWAAVCTKKDAGAGIWQEVRWNFPGQEDGRLCMMN